MLARLCDVNATKHFPGFLAELDRVGRGDEILDESAAGGWPWGEEASRR